MTTLKPLRGLFPLLTDPELRAVAAIAGARGMTADRLAADHQVRAEIEQGAIAVADALVGPPATQLAGALLAYRDPRAVRGAEYWLSVAGLLADPVGPLATIAVALLELRADHHDTPHGWGALLASLIRQYPAASGGERRDLLVRLAAAAAAEIAQLDEEVTR